MTRETVLTTLAFLTFCGTLEAAGWKGVTVSLPPASIALPQSRPFEAQPPPDLSVAVKAGRAKGDSLRIYFGPPPWANAYPYPRPSQGGDRLFPGDMRNIERGLLRARREAFPVQSNIFNLNKGVRNRMNALSMYVSVTDGGGLGFRVLYDRRLRSTLGLNVSGEFTTFDGYRLARLQADLPDYTGRVSVIGLFTGLQQRLVDRGRVVPRLGLAAGPIIRLDHREPPFYGGFYSPFGGIGSVYGTNGLDMGIGLPIGDFPSLSLSFGGYADAGLDVVVGGDRLYAISLDARYNLIHFFDAMGNPGDFGGPAFYVGFGRRF